MTESTNLDDLRFGYAPLPAPASGYLPAADAQAIMLPTLASPATLPVPGVQYTGSYAPGERYVVRVPRAWNGSLVVAGTPATRNEFTNDLIWGELALARGYAFASSNKGVAVNALLEPTADVTDRRTVYPIPFDSGGLLAQPNFEAGTRLRVDDLMGGALEQCGVAVEQVVVEVAQYQVALGAGR